MLATLSSSSVVSALSFSNFNRFSLEKVSSNKSIIVKSCKDQTKSVTLEFGANLAAHASEYILGLFSSHWNVEGRAILMD